MSNKFVKLTVLSSTSYSAQGVAFLSVSKIVHVSSRDRPEGGICTIVDTDENTYMVAESIEDVMALITGEPVAKPATWCAECGPNVACDEDGGCEACGALCIGAGAERALALVRDAPSREVLRHVAQHMRDDVLGMTPDGNCSKKLREVAAWLEKVAGRNE